jgi:hypothetical protein
MEAYWNSPPKLTTMSCLVYILLTFV